MTWDQFVSWFITAALGAFIIKLFDLAANQYSQRRSRKESKVNILLNYVKEFGELTDLYRLITNVSSKMILDANGKPKRDKDGNLITEKKILEPQPTFEEAIKELKGADINAAIAQKIVSIQLNSSEVLDIADELDKTGKLRKSFTELYLKTVWAIKIVLDGKEHRDPHQSFQQMINALQDADEFRRNLGNKIQSYLK